MPIKVQHTVYTIEVRNGRRDCYPDVSVNEVFTAEEVTEMLSEIKAELATLREQVAPVKTDRFARQPEESVKDYEERMDPYNWPGVYPLGPGNYCGPGGYTPTHKELEDRF